uniref:Uncharacterized protein n=1 Tax=Sphaerodactylus townsendi TaxID=933632 RepID=A0ACB8EYG0_9SAUR
MMFMVLSSLFDPYETSETSQDESQSVLGFSTSLGSPTKKFPPWSVSLTRYASTSGDARLQMLKFSEDEMPLDERMEWGLRPYLLSLIQAFS